MTTENTILAAALIGYRAGQKAAAKPATDRSVDLAAMSTAVRQYQSVASDAKPVRPPLYETESFKRLVAKQSSRRRWG